MEYLELWHFHFKNSSTRYPSNTTVHSGSEGQCQAGSPGSHRSLFPLFACISRYPDHGEQPLPGRGFPAGALSIGSVPGRVCLSSLPCLPSVGGENATAWPGKGCRFVWLPEQGIAGRFTDPLATLLCSQTSPRTPGHLCHSQADHSSPKHFLATD